MGKRKKPPPKKPPQAPPQAPPPEPPQKPTTRKLLLQILATGWGKFLALYLAFATFAAVVGGGFLFLSIYEDTIPEITSEGTSSSAMALPFTVTNKSVLFSMREAKLACGIDIIKVSSGVGVKGVTIIHANGEEDIDPQGTANFRCLVGTADEPPRTMGFAFRGRVVSAHLFLSVKYRTLWIGRTSPNTEFTWFDAPSGGRWIRGKVVE